MIVSLVYSIQYFYNTLGAVHMTRNQINDTFLFQNRVKVKVVGEVSEK